MEKKKNSTVCGASLALVGYSAGKSPVTLAYRYILSTDKFADLLSSLLELRESYKDSYDSVSIHLQTVETRVIY